MPETMDFYIKAVVDLWTEQATEAPNGAHPGADISPRKLARPFMEAYKRKIGKMANYWLCTAHYSYSSHIRIYSFLIFTLTLFARHTHKVNEVPGP